MPVALVHFRLAGQNWTADLANATDLSRPIGFSGQERTWFGAPAPRAVPLESGDFVGDVSRGGPANVSVLSLAPHCVGTHTEGIGHLTRKPQALTADSIPGLIPATLVTLDRVSSEAISRLFSPQHAFLEALIIRRRQGVLTYEPEALSLAASLGAQHLIVEDVSIDPESDDGRLAAHRAWWGMEEGSVVGRSHRTITELAVIPDSTGDGRYLLNLQVPPLVTDAAPSRPLLYPVTPA